MVNAKKVISDEMTNQDNTGTNLYIKVAQLSQRDCAAGWVSYGQKWKTETGRQYLRTL